MSRCRLLRRARSRIYACDARLIDNADVQIVDHTDLARQPCMISEIGLGREDRFFGLSDRTRIAAEDLYPTRCTPGISTAPVQDVNAVVFKRKYELTIVLCLY
jgi:hypothetical protein